MLTAIAASSSAVSLRPAVSRCLCRALGGEPPQVNATMSGCRLASRVQATPCSQRRRSTAPPPPSIRGAIRTTPTPAARAPVSSGRCPAESGIDVTYRNACAVPAGGPRPGRPLWYEMFMSPVITETPTAGAELRLDAIRRARPRSDIASPARGERQRHRHERVRSVVRAGRRTAASRATAPVSRDEHRFVDEDRGRWLRRWLSSSRRRRA